MEIRLSIGGCVIRILEPKGYSTLAWPLRPFEEFLAPPALPADIHVDVSVAMPLPEIRHGRVLFDAGEGLWKAFETDTGLAIESLDTCTLQPRVRATISGDYRRIHAWILPEYVGGQVGWCPMYLFNPVVEVCFLTRLSREGGLLLHAAGLVSEQQGYVFSGPSGAGKSTIAQLFAGRQASVLSDERMILRQHHETILLHGSPWVGSGQYAANSSATLTAVYIIEHGVDRHQVVSVPPSTAVTRLLQQSFLPRWDHEGMERTLDFVISIVSRVPCRGLAFLPQDDIVDLIHHTSSHAPSATMVTV